MTAHLYVAPAAAGKTAWVVDQVRSAARGLACTPIVVVPTPLQARSFRRRLAAAGGALGVYVLTFDELHSAVLQQANANCTELAEPVRYRLMRALIDEAAAQGELVFYAPLAASPGFVSVVLELIQLFKGAAVRPDELLAALPTDAAYHRQRELGELYRRYQQRLQEQAWSDRTGMAWLALEALRAAQAPLPAAWTPIVFDGFATFTPVQLAIVAALAARCSQLIVTLTGAVDAANGAAAPRPAHRLFATTAADLRRALQIEAEPLPVVQRHAAPALQFLVDHLFDPTPAQAPPEAPSGPTAARAITRLELSNRTAEVRAALRWLKQRCVEDGMSPGDLALLARSLPAYREIIVQVAAEFGLPIHVIDGLPLNRNPAVAALLDLLRLLLPDPDGQGMAMPRRQVVEAWRSPYFDWQRRDPHDPMRPGIEPGDAERLDEAARRGQVIGGEVQWLEALERQAASRQIGSLALADAEAEEGASRQDLAAAPALLDKFRRFSAALAPPPPGPLRSFVTWLEDLIGQDPHDAAWSPGDSGNGGNSGVSQAPHFALNLVACAAAAPASAERDVAALRAFKEVLRGLVWSAEALQTDDAAPPVMDFPTFVAELSGAADAALYQPASSQAAGVLVASTLQARGVPVAAAAIIGLAEGELPQPKREDPFLRDADRRLLRAAGLELELSTASQEREYFYDAVARASDCLLLTRPRYADSGAEWEPSPYWEEVGRLTAQPPLRILSSQPHPPASRQELVEQLAQLADGAALTWLAAVEPGCWERVERGAHLLAERSRADRSPLRFDGDLSHAAPALAQRFGADHMWSPSRLEQYLTCGFWFLTTSVLDLTPRELPQEGLAISQLGSLYHRILELLYRNAGDMADLAGLLAALPSVAAAVLDVAPAQMGFRVTRWWEQEKVAIVAKLARSVIALHALSDGFVPVAFELHFGDQQPLAAEIGGQRVLLHGIIDRLDRLDRPRAGDGSGGQAGALRVLDYKSAASGYEARDLRDGKKIQLPLYALAAQEALQLGSVADGFYWLIGKAAPSGLSLAGFDGGVAGAVETALGHVARAVEGVRSGAFAPTPPALGCPAYCPAAAFCWRHQPSAW